MRKAELALRRCLGIAEGVPFCRRRGRAGVVAGFSGSDLGVHVQILDMEARMSVQVLDVGYHYIIPPGGSLALPVDLLADID
ncbi:hypothetical protein AO069_26745 [Pseudomonas syringae pv. syringae PD2774]|nr:hypothetical protein AO069_26745 [Pseudomonas syringae pv. syringae PD2774]